MTPDRLRGGLLVVCWLILWLNIFVAVLGLLWRHFEEDN